MLDWQWSFQFTVLITKLETYHAKPSIYCHDVAHDYHENLKSSIPKVCHQSLLSIDDYAFGALPLQVYSYIVPLWSVCGWGRSDGMLCVVGGEGVVPCNRFHDTKRVTNFLHNVQQISLHKLWSNWSLCGLLCPVTDFPRYTKRLTNLPTKRVTNLPKPVPTYQCVRV